MDALASRVLIRFQRQAGFIPDKFWKAKKAELRQILLDPITSLNLASMSYMLSGKLRTFFSRFHEELRGFGMHGFAETSLRERVHALMLEIDGFSKSYDELAAALGSYHPVKTIEDEVVLSISSHMSTYVEERVKNLRDALKGKWSADPRTIRGIAERWLRKAPPEVIKALEEEVSSPDHIPSDDAIRIKWHWLKSMGLDNMHPMRDQKRTKLDPLKWIDFLHDVFATVHAEPEAFTEFDLHGVKVVVDDSTVDTMDVKRYVRYLDHAHALLKNKGLEKVWHGTFFIKCESCGGVNPNNPSAGTGGDYPVGPDVVNIYVRPSEYVVELIAHELGHRYWFKYMNESKRGKFESLVRVKSEPAVKLDVYQKQTFDKTLKEARKALAEFIDFLPKTLKKLTADFDKAEKFVPTPGAEATVDDEIAQELQGLEHPIIDWMSWPGMPQPSGYTYYLAEDKLKNEAAVAEKARFELLTHLEATNKIPGTQEWDPTKAQEGLRAVREWIKEAWRLQAAYLLGMTRYLDAMERLSQKQYVPFPENPRPVAPVSDYGASNIEEAFAEVFAHYVVGKDMHRDQIESFKEVLASTSERVVERFLTSLGAERMLRGS